MPNEMERLIELLSSCPTDYAGNRNVAVVAKHLLDNGVIVPPCKVGDAVWFVLESEMPEVTPEVLFDLVEKITINRYSDSNPALRIPDRIVTTQMLKVPFEALGKWVFFSREDAIKYLKEREADNG